MEALTEEFGSKVSVNNDSFEIPGAGPDGMISTWKYRLIANKW